MSSKTRKRFLPVALVMAVAAIGVVALAIALAGGPRDVQAHGDGPGCGDTAASRAVHDNLQPPAHGNCPVPTPTTPPGTPSGTPSGNGMMGDGGTITSSSDSASAGVKLVLKFEMPMDAQAGSSVELYLEDDFKMGDSISRDSVYFTVDSTDARVNGGGRVYPADPVESDEDEHFTAGKDDISIQVFIPDMNTRDTDDGAGYQGPDAGEMVTLTFTKSAGITNPSEAGTHSVGYSVLGPDDGANDGPMYRTDKVFAKDSAEAMAAQGSNKMVTTGMRPDDQTGDFADVGLKTVAKVSLSDENNSRGYELTVTGTGFNNGVSAAAYVYASDTAPADCAEVQAKGTEAGSATVGSDDKAVITFEVTAPTFKPGNVNYVCAVDGEGLMSSDVDMFELEPSIRVSPTQVNSGDTVTVFAQDFVSGSFATLKLAGQQVHPTIPENAVLPLVKVSSTNIQDDGSATATFAMPGGLKGTVRVDAKWGDTNENTKITIAPSTLSATKTDVLPNETITITGNGFGNNACIALDKITLDNVPIQVDDESDDRCGPLNASGVRTSNAGQFVATIHLAPIDTDSSDPTLIAGTHTLDVADSKGFTGSVTLTIPDPAIKIHPDVAGPRDYITVTGENWPVDNPENPLSESVDVRVMDTQNGRRYSTFADSAGRFSIEHQVHRGVAIPSTIQIEVKYGTVVKIATFDVPVATIEVTPAEAQPGDMVTISATNMPVYTDASEVKIGGSTIGNLSAHTDRDGNITVENVLVPGLDPGTYSVQLKVKDTVAIGEIDVLPEGVSGAATALPDAVAGFGDNLDAIFHFNNSSKEWTFFDPRPEFAELNTLTELNGGQPYWVLVKDNQEDVNWNNRLVDFTCAADDCWNLEIW